MLALAEISGLPLTVHDDLENFLDSPEDVVCSSTLRVKLQEITPTLLNKSLRYPEFVYEQRVNVMNREDQEMWPQGVEYDIISIPAGLLGIEYIKTHIFYSNEVTEKAACIVHVLCGTLTVVLQRNAPKLDKYDIETKVQEASLVEVSAPAQIVIPTGYYYTFVNAYDKPVVFGRVVGREHILDYAQIRRESGLAYYVIAKNARQEIVANPRYRLQTEVKKVSLDDVNCLCSAYKTTETPLYQQVKSLGPTLCALLY